MINDKTNKEEVIVSKNVSNCLHLLFGSKVEAKIRHDVYYEHIKFTDIRSSKDGTG